jgi:hypothetical protein
VVAAGPVDVIVVVIVVVVVVVAAVHDAQASDPGYGCRASR